MDNRVYSHVLFNQLEGAAMAMEASCVGTVRHG